MSRRTCHWPGCKRAPIYVRKVKLRSGRIQTQIRADNEAGTPSRASNAITKGNQ